MAMKTNWDIKNPPKSRHPVNRFVDWLDNKLKAWERKLQEK
jgi:hypothetical protein